MLAAKRRQTVTMAVLCLVASFATAYGKSTFRLNTYGMSFNADLTTDVARRRDGENVSKVRMCLEIDDC